MCGKTGKSLRVAAACMAAVRLWSLVWTGAALGQDTAALDPAVPAEQYESAMNKALDWLAKQQKADGSWPTAYGPNTAVTSLAVMAFLAKGHVPGLGPYGQVIRRGVRFVLNSQRPNGLLVVKTSHGPMYSHGISTLMLTQVLGQMPTRQEERAVREALGKAIRLILQAQKVPKSPRDAGGWRYQHTSKDSDISVTGWCVMALRAAKNCGAQVPEEAIDAAIQYIQRCAGAAGGFGYRPGGGPNQSRTGIGILCLEIAGGHLLAVSGKEHHDLAVRGGEWLLKHPYKQFNGGHFYYGIYYCSQAAYQLGCKYWDTFYRPLAKMILANQKPDGSWPIERGSGKGGGPVYATAMAVLALTVQEHVLPVYQR